MVGTVDFTLSTFKITPETIKLSWLCGYGKIDGFKYVSNRMCEQKRS